MFNPEVLALMAVTGVKRYQIADYLNVAESKVSRSLRRELSEKEKEQYLDVVRILSGVEVV